MVQVPGEPFDPTGSPIPSDTGNPGRLGPRNKGRRKGRKRQGKRNRGSNAQREPIIRQAVQMQNVDLSVIGDPGLTGAQPLGQMSVLPGTIALNNPLDISQQGLGNSMPGVSLVGEPIVVFDPTNDPMASGLLPLGSPVDMAAMGQVPNDARILKHDTPPADRSTGNVMGGAGLVSVPVMGGVKQLSDVAGINQGNILPNGVAPADYVGRQAIINSPSSNAQTDLPQLLGAAHVDGVQPTNHDIWNPQQIQPIRKNRKNKNKKGRRTNARRMPIIEEVVQSDSVNVPVFNEPFIVEAATITDRPIIPDNHEEIAHQERLINIQRLRNTRRGSTLIKRAGKPQPVDLSLIGPNANEAGMSPLIGPNDGMIGPRQGRVAQHGGPRRQTRNNRNANRQARINARAEAKALRKANALRRVERFRKLREERQLRKASRKSGGPKIKAARKMETVDLSNMSGGAPSAIVAKPKPTTPKPNLDCIAGLGCIDWSMGV